jgi:hypothetical protein
VGEREEFVILFKIYRPLMWPTETSVRTAGSDRIGFEDGIGLLKPKLV